MNIGMILDSSFPPDIRVEKEARCLIEHDHRVFLLSRLKTGQLKEEIINRIHILRIPSENSFLSRTYNYGIFSLDFINLEWKAHIHHFINKYDIEILHIHDLPLVKTGLIVAREHSIPIIADLHENYAEAVKAWNTGNRSFLTKIFEYPLNPSRWEKIAKEVLPQVNHIIAVVDEGKKYYENVYGIQNNRITVIMNTEDLDYYDSIKINDEIIKENSSKYIISYIGGFGPHRGIDTAIKAMPKIVMAIPDAQLLLVGGKGSLKFESEIRDLINSLNVKDHVKLTGWVDFSLVPSYIAASSVCLIPHHASGHTNSTIPHKLFQYMAMKKSVITTDCTPLKRIVEETQAGIVIPSGDSDALADAVNTLYSNPTLARRYGENGRKAVETIYNWRNESKKLVYLYERIAK